MKQHADLLAEADVTDRYRTIVADPPWRYRSSLPPLSGTPHDTARDRLGPAPRSSVRYDMMSAAEIAALPIPDLAATDAHLYLWTTNTHLQEAFEIVRAWGFTYSTTLVWCKQPRGLVGGAAYTICTEFVLFCRRGTLAATERLDRNWWLWARGRHSQKPDAFLDTVERVSPGPYAELFARRARFGWHYPIGDQALGGVAA